MHGFSSSRISRVISYPRSKNTARTYHSRHPMDRRSPIRKLSRNDKAIGNYSQRTLPAVHGIIEREGKFAMSQTIPPASDNEASFAETALKLGGKSEDEARRTGAIDKADDQVEALFAPQYQT